MASTIINETKGTRRGWRIARIASLALAAWIILAWVAARALIIRAELQHADAIVVLSGSSTHRERTRHAARLFHEGRAPKIILTNDGLQGNWSTEQQRNPFNIEREMDELRQAGVPGDKIEALPQLVSSTYEEARLLRDYMVNNRLRSILIVTSAYHSRRASWTFRRVLNPDGIEVGLGSPPPGDQTPNAATWWLHLSGWRMVAGEYVKLVYYLVGSP